MPSRLPPFPKGKGPKRNIKSPQPPTPPHLVNEKAHGSQLGPLDHHVSTGSRAFLLLRLGCRVYSIPNTYMVQFKKKKKNTYMVKFSRNSRYGLAIRRRNFRCSDFFGWPGVVPVPGKQDMPRPSAIPAAATAYAGVVVPSQRRGGRPMDGMSGWRARRTGTPGGDEAAAASTSPLVILPGPSPSSPRASP